MRKKRDLFHMQTLWNLAFLTRLVGLLRRFKKSDGSIMEPYEGPQVYIFESSVFIIKCNFLLVIMKVAPKPIYIVSFYSILIFELENDDQQCRMLSKGQ